MTSFITKVNDLAHTTDTMMNVRTTTVQRNIGTAGGTPVLGVMFATIAITVAVALIFFRRPSAVMALAMLKTLMESTMEATERRSSLLIIIAMVITATYT